MYRERSCIARWVTKRHGSLRHLQAARYNPHQLKTEKIYPSLAVKAGLPGAAVTRRFSEVLLVLQGDYCKDRAGEYR